MPRKWSERLIETFKISLTPDVVDWLDGEVREEEPTDYLSSFDEPIDVDQLLDPASSTVWGGLMLPDTLPILGNGCGDGPGVTVRTGRWTRGGNSLEPRGRVLAALWSDAC